MEEARGRRGERSNEREKSYRMLCEMQTDMTCKGMEVGGRGRYRKRQRDRGRSREGERERERER
jgi:hypothetical protein